MACEPAELGQQPSWRGGSPACLSRLTEGSGKLARARAPGWPCAGSSTGICLTISRGCWLLCGTRCHCFLLSFCLSLLCRPGSTWKAACVCAATGLWARRPGGSLQPCISRELPGGAGHGPPAHAEGRGIWQSQDWLLRWRGRLRQALQSSCRDLADLQGPCRQLGLPFGRSCRQPFCLLLKLAFEGLYAKGPQSACPALPDQAAVQHMCRLGVLSGSKAAEGLCALRLKPAPEPCEVVAPCWDWRRSSS